MFHAVAAGIPDVEEKGVLVERRCREDRVLVADQLLDVADEALAHAGGRRAVVVHHRAVLLSVHGEGIEHERRCDLRRRVDEPVVVLEGVHELTGGARVAVDHLPARGRRDGEGDRIRLVVLHVHEQAGAIPVRVGRVQDAVRSGQCVGEDAISDAHTPRTGRPDDPARSVALVPCQRAAVRRRHLEFLHVLREVHARIPTGGPHGQLHGQLSNGDAVHVDLDVIQVRCRIGHRHAIGDAERRRSGRHGGRRGRRLDECGNEQQLASGTHWSGGVTGGAESRTAKATRHRKLPTERSPRNRHGAACAQRYDLLAVG